MAKPTFASVTEIPCSCGFLEQQASEPDTPIVFNQELNEFHIEYESKGQGKGSIMIYHCPFCGGAAPESQRGKLFAAIPRQEEERLYGLFEDSKTIEDVLKKFGPPDQDHSRGVGVQTPEKDNNAPTSERFRTLVYSKLSDVADVHVTDYNKDRVHIMLLGKYVGKP